jgi:prepilin-type N-terminal cleavage/methylation domain-containing protein
MTPRILDNKGLTLVELTVVLAILAVLVAMSFDPGVRLMRWIEETETKKILLKLQNAVTDVYENNAWSVDSSPAAAFTFNFGGSTHVLVNGISTDPGNLNALRAIASSVANIPIGDIERDSMRNPMQVFISNRLVDTALGIHYRVVAIVSPGWDGEFNSSFNIATGALTLQKDDLGMIVSGFSIQQDNIIETNRKLAIIRDAYQNHFTSLFLSDPNRSVHINRFARRNNNCGANQFWDARSFVDNSNCVSNTASGIGLKAAVSASRDAITTAWGREMLIDNSSAVTRNPDNTGSTPPYTARVLAELPWGGFLDATVVGKY